MREINVSRAGDPVHAGDKALTLETPAKRGGLTGMVCCHFFHLFKRQIMHKTNPDKEQTEITIGRHFEPQPIRGSLANELR